MMYKNCFTLFVMLNLTVCCISALKTCPEQYQTYENGNKCFSFLPSRAQWMTAEQACQQNDGTLAKIENGFDEVFISSQAYSFYATYADNDVWIGLNNLVDSDSYQWTDGSTPKYTDWGKGQPLTQGPYCVSQTFKNGNNLVQYWSSESCFDFKFFVCEWNGNLTSPTTTTTTTTLPPPTTTTTTTTLKSTVLTTKFIPDAPTTAAQTEAQTYFPSEFPTTVDKNDATTTPEPSSPECDFNFTFNYQDGRCYKVLDPLSVTDRDYESGCHQFNGHLPSIHTIETNEFIVDLV
uniref:C-type lectin domain-containing protein n=1 Tax=Panagrolaimus sp. ES5 TaxID=591445 RepID=A0AC34FU13_9BILA